MCFPLGIAKNKRILTLFYRKNNQRKKEKNYSQNIFTDTFKKYRPIVHELRAYAVYKKFDFEGQFMRYVYCSKIMQPRYEGHTVW